MTVAKLPYLWLTAGQYLWKPRSESKDRHPSAQAHGGCRMRALTALGLIASYSAGKPIWRAVALAAHRCRIKLYLLGISKWKSRIIIHSA
jgi:hypothetical protein